MKKLIFGLGIVVAGLTCSVASAQYYGGDCCPPVCDPCCVSDFNGFYFGGNLGVISEVAHLNHIDESNTSLNDSRSISHVATDFTIGLQLGYDWQCGCSLFGLVADWNWVNVNHSFFGRCRNDDSWFLTIRGRAGVTVCDCLFYLTAGAATADLKARWNNDFFSSNSCRNAWGWVGGVGVEYLLGCNWSVGADLLFMHFDEKRHTREDQRFGHSVSFYTARLLLNYRFGDLFGGLL